MITCAASSMNTIECCPAREPQVVHLSGSINWRQPCDIAMPAAVSLQRAIRSSS